MHVVAHQRGPSSRGTDNVAIDPIIKTGKITPFAQTLVTWPNFKWGQITLYTQTLGTWPKFQKKESNYTITPIINSRFSSWNSRK